VVDEGGGMPVMLQSKFSCHYCRQYMVSLVQGFPTKGEIHSRGEFLGFRGTD